MIEKFAQYGFNKSHSTAYAYVAYQTAWLKTYYPAEFMSANLTSEMSNIDRIVILINECRKLKIDVNPPDVNISDINFRPVDKKTISFGLNALLFIFSFIFYILPLLLILQLHCLYCKSGHPFLQVLHLLQLGIDF